MTKPGGPTEWTAANVPLPPSLWELYVRRKGGKGLATSPKYAAWQDAAGWALKALRPPTFDGPYSLEIVLPQAVKLDADNAVKPFVDLLVSLKITPDDKHMSQVVCRRSATRPLDIGCMIIVRAA